MRIGFLGTGIMGAPMAGHLARAGHEVAVWNRTEEKARRVGAGTRVASSPADAVAGAQVVVTMLSDGATVEDVITPALDAFAPDAVWWQASTVGLEAIDRLQTIADQREIALVDGPVLGTKQPAEEGKLIVLASGPADAVDTLLELF